jgi:hypothetical protein
MDNTTFGNEIPTLPQWASPPLAMVQFQGLLATSLGSSLFPAFVAMLGKQWLTRYESIDVGEPTIEHSRNRQQKLRGIVGWYFYYTMELLPMMLQVAFLLFSCALSCYLLETDISLASYVVFGTSFGVFFYLFIAMAGAFSYGCLYQTSSASTLRFTSAKMHLILFLDFWALFAHKCEQWGLLNPSRCIL